jgi:hypothetical protein
MQLQLITSVVDIGSKYAAGVNKTIGKFADDVIDTSDAL